MLLQLYRSNVCETCQWSCPRPPWRGTGRRRLYRRAPTAAPGQKKQKKYNMQGGRAAKKIRATWGLSPNGGGCALPCLDTCCDALQCFASYRNLCPVPCPNVFLLLPRWHHQAKDCEACRWSCPRPPWRGTGRRRLYRRAPTEAPNCSENRQAGTEGTYVGPPEGSDASPAPAEGAQVNERRS